VIHLLSRFILLTFGVVVSFCWRIIVVYHLIFHLSLDSYWNFDTNSHLHTSSSPSPFEGEKSCRIGECVKCLPDSSFIVKLSIRLSLLSVTWLVCRRQDRQSSCKQLTENTPNKPVNNNQTINIPPITYSSGESRVRGYCHQLLQFYYQLNNHDWSRVKSLLFLHYCHPTVQIIQSNHSWDPSWGKVRHPKEEELGRPGIFPSSNPTSM